MSKEGFKEYFKRFENENGFFLMAQHKTNEINCLVHFTKSEKKISNDDVKKLGIQMNNQGIKHCIIISNEELSLQAQKMIVELDTQKAFHFEHFLISELIVNITHHELVPKHVLISDEEKESVLKKFKIKESQLPKILTTDPVARYLGLKKGQLVKIIRNSETAGLHIAYRAVI